MANVKISELPAASTPLTGAELVPVVQSGVTSQTTVNNLTAGKSISVSAINVTGSTASGSGLVLAPQMVRINTTRDKTTNDTSLEAIFDSANDALALAANTLYYFKGQYYLTMGNIAGANSFKTGFIFSNTQQDIQYTTIGGNSSGNPALFIISIATAATSTPNVIGSSVVSMQIEGWFKSNATTGGTVIPAFAPNAVGGTSPKANAGTWLMIQPMSSNPNATVLAGNWS